MFYLTSPFLLSSYILYLTDYSLLWDVYVLSQASPSYLKPIFLISLDNHLSHPLHLISYIIFLSQLNMFYLTSFYLLSYEYSLSHLLFSSLECICIISSLSFLSI